MKRIAGLLFIFFALGVADLAAASGQVDILARTVVPSLDKPQGEVRLIRRDEQLVVQTLLASRILKRVVAAIDKKEQHRWPEAVDGHVDSRRYRQELFRATTESRERFRQRSDKSVKRQYLAIEFILGPGQSIIAISEPRLSGDYGQFRVEGATDMARWRASRDYVAENMKAIVRDSFKTDAAAVEELLNANWPKRP